MPKHFFLLLFASISSFGFAIDKAAAQRIGEQIWINECGKSKEKLTFWSANEGFPSLGIGHFIWYVKGKEEPYEEMFPQLARYLRKRGEEVPEWALGPSPWQTREEFYAEFQGTQMKRLRELLYETRALQVDFMVERMEKGLGQFHMSALIHKLKQDPKGIYALVDYTNFKGLGINPSERYKGQGWGLLQVLEAIPADSKNVVQDFVGSAKRVLAERVKNAPPERNEARWLPGWNNRLETYLNF